MEALYFGESQSPLYGVYHAPKTSSYTSRAILMCYPAGHEYIRIHRCYRQIASLLTEKGYHVFRFDFFGSGDSSGEHIEISMERWLQDAKSALAELRALSGVRKVSIMGARIGALIAAQLAAIDGRVDTLLLWEALESPADFIDQMLDNIDANEVSSSNYIEKNGTLHFNGYPFSEATLRSIRNAGYPGDWASTPQKCGLLSGAESDFRFLDHLNAKVDIMNSAKPIDWNGLDAIGGLFLPIEDVKAMVSYLC